MLSGEGCLGGGADAGDVLLNALEQIEGGARTGTMALGFQAHAHDAVKHEGEEADHGVSADTVGKPVMHRRDLDLDIGFEDAEATLDVCEALVARDCVSGGEVRGVGDQRQLSIEKFCLCNGVFIDAPAEAISVEIGLEEAG